MMREFTRKCSFSISRLPIVWLFSPVHLQVSACEQICEVVLARECVCAGDLCYKTQCETTHTSSSLLSVLAIDSYSVI